MPENVQHPEFDQLTPEEHEALALFFTRVAERVEAEEPVTPFNIPLRGRTRDTASAGLRRLARFNATMAKDIRLTAAEAKRLLEGD